MENPGRETYFEWVDRLYEEAYDKGTDEAIDVLRRIPNAIIDRPSLREVVAEAHLVDDQDWRFNCNNLVNELIRIASPPDIEWSDMSDLYDEIWVDLEEIFPVRI